MRKRFLTVGLLSALAIVGLASCGDGSGGVKIKDADGNDVVIKKTSDSTKVAEALNVISSLNTYTAVNKIELDVDAEANILEVASDGTTIVNKIQGTAEADLKLSKEGQQFSSINSSSYTPSQIEAARNKISKMKASADVKVDGTIVSPEGSFTAKLEATAVKGILNSNDGAYVDVQNCEFTTTSDDYVIKMIDSITDGINKAKVFVGPEVYAKRDSDVISVNNDLASITSLPANMALMYYVLSNEEAAKKTTTKEIVECLGLTITKAKGSTVTLKSTESDDKVLGYKCKAVREITLDVSKNILTEINYEATNMTPQSPENSFKSNVFKAEIDISYNDLVSIAEPKADDYMSFEAFKDLIFPTKE